jgi:hypothetical protein
MEMEIRKNHLLSLFEAMQGWEECLRFWIFPPCGFSVVTTDHSANRLNFLISKERERVTTFVFVRKGGTLWEKRMKKRKWKKKKDRLSELSLSR